MKTRIAITLIMTVSLIFLAQSVFADDLADLKATHQRFIQAWNTSDMETVFEIWQDGGIWLPSSRAFPVLTNSAMGKQMFSKWLETHFYNYNWYKVDYRVIGDTGLVWGVTSTVVVVKQTGMGKRYFHKATLVFVKSGGKWQAVMSQETPILSEAEIF